MIALQFSEYGPPDVLTLADVPQPHAGPGEIRIAVRAAGVTPGECVLRAGGMKDRIPLALPHVLCVDAAGIVDEVGEGVTDVQPGDAVFGMVDIARLGGAAAEYAVLVAWEAKPDALSWEQAGGAAANIETATRTLDKVGADAGMTLLIEGAAGGVGTVAIQLAVARGVTVIGTARESNHEFLAGLGAIPTTYGPGLAERVAALAPQGVDRVLDYAGSGSLPDLIAIAGGPDRVVSIADLRAEEHGVELSHTGGPGATTEHGLHGLKVAAALAEEGRFTVPVAAAFPFKDAAAAHELSETGHARGKIVLTL